MEEKEFYDCYHTTQGYYYSYGNSLFCFPYHGITTVLPADDLAEWFKYMGVVWGEI